jgi:tetratricopeptide (TPR) repeat protein
MQAWYAYASGERQLRLAATGILYIFCFWTTAAFAVDPAKIIFFPADASSVPGNLSWLSDGLSFSISGQLRGPGIKVVDRQERLQLVEDLDLPPDAHLSHGSMIRVAQEGRADLAIWASFSGSEQNLKVAVRILDMKNMKLSGEITANGPLSAMPQMENELGWLILSNAGVQKGVSREYFGMRQRKIPNAEYASFIQSFSATGRNEQIRLLQKALDGFKEFPEAHFQLGRLYFQKGEWDNALVQLSLSAKAEGMDPEYEFIRGTCLVQRGQPVPAIQSLLNVLSSSRSFRILNNIGVAYLRKGDTAQALNAFMEARNLARSDTTVAINLAIARHLQGNDAAARNALEDAAKTTPKNRMLQFLSGIVLKSLGESVPAAAAMARAKDLGLDTDKLLSEDPMTWCLVHTVWEH